eukprot:8308055-Lingulodinium_polyedra.AAC.1
MGMSSKENGRHTPTAPGPRAPGPKVCVPRTLGAQGGWAHARTSKLALGGEFRPAAPPLLGALP